MSAMKLYHTGQRGAEQRAPRLGIVPVVILAPREYATPLAGRRETYMALDIYPYGRRAK